MMGSESEPIPRQVKQVSTSSDVAARDPLSLPIPRKKGKSPISLQAAGTDSNEKDARSIPKRSDTLAPRLAKSPMNMEAKNAPISDSVSRKRSRGSDMNYAEIPTKKVEPDKSKSTPNNSSTKRQRGDDDSAPMSGLSDKYKKTPNIRSRNRQKGDDDSATISGNSYTKVKSGRTSGYPVIVVQGKSEHEAILLGCNDSINPQDHLTQHKDGNVKIRWLMAAYNGTVPANTVRLKQIDAVRPVRKAAELSGLAIENQRAEEHGEDDEDVPILKAVRLDRMEEHHSKEIDKYDGDYMDEEDRDEALVCYTKTASVGLLGKGSLPSAAASQQDGSSYLGESSNTSADTNVEAPAEGGNYSMIDKQLKPQEVASNEILKDEDAPTDDEAHIEPIATTIDTNIEAAVEGSNYGVSSKQLKPEDMTSTESLKHEDVPTDDEAHIEPISPVQAEQEINEQHDELVPLETKSNRAVKLEDSIDTDDEDMAMKQYNHVDTGTDEFKPEDVLSNKDAASDAFDGLEKKKPALPTEAKFDVRPINHETKQEGGVPDNKAADKTEKSGGGDEGGGEDDFIEFMGEFAKEGPFTYELHRVIVHEILEEHHAKGFLEIHPPDRSRTKRQFSFWVEFPGDKGVIAGRIDQTGLNRKRFRAIACKAYVNYGAWHGPLRLDEDMPGVNFHGLMKTFGTNIAEAGSKNFSANNPLHIGRVHPLRISRNEPEISHPDGFNPVGGYKPMKAGCLCFTLFIGDGESSYGNCRDAPVPIRLWFRPLESSSYSTVKIPAEVKEDIDKLPKTISMPQEGANNGGTASNHDDKHNQAEASVDKMDHGKSKAQSGRNESGKSTALPRPATNDSAPSSKKGNIERTCPMNAYMMYVNSIRAQIKEDNPDFSNGDIMEEIGIRYKMISDYEKGIWQAKADAAKENYVEDEYGKPGIGGKHGVNQAESAPINQAEPAPMQTSNMDLPSLKMSCKVGNEGTPLSEKDKEEMICSICKVNKALENFSKNQRSKGNAAKCKDCIPTKKCFICKINKTLHSFSKEEQSKVHAAKCKDCMKAKERCKERTRIYELHQVIGKEILGISEELDAKGYLKIDPLEGNIARFQVTFPGGRGSIGGRIDQAGLIACCGNHLQAYINYGAWYGPLCRSRNMPEVNVHGILMSFGTNIGEGGSSLEMTRNESESSLLNSFIPNGRYEPTKTGCICFTLFIENSESSDASSRDVAVPIRLWFRPLIERICSICKLIKTPNNFSKSQLSKGITMSKCKDCLRLMKGRQCATAMQQPEELPPPIEPMSTVEAIKELNGKHDELAPLEAKSNSSLKLEERIEDEDLSMKQLDTVRSLETKEFDYETDTSEIKPESVTSNKFDKHEEAETDDEAELQKPDLAMRSEKKKRKKDPNAPKRPKSAFMFYAAVKGNEMKEANPDATFGELSKLVGAAWAALSDGERAKWNEKAERDMLRYQKEMKSYTPPSDYDDSDDDIDYEAKKPMTKRAKKDPTAPKRPMNAYMLYSNSVRAQIKKDNPNFAIGDVSKEVSMRYKMISDEEKAKWQAKADEAKKVYDDEKAKWQSKFYAAKEVYKEDEYGRSTIGDDNAELKDVQDVYLSSGYQAESAPTEKSNIALTSLKRPCTVSNEGTPASKKGKSERICSICNVNKAPEIFSKNQRSKGDAAKCKDCVITMNTQNLKRICSICKVTKTLDSFSKKERSKLHVSKGKPNVNAAKCYECARQLRLWMNRHP